MDTIFALKFPGGLALRRDGSEVSLFALRAFVAGEPVMQLEHITWRPWPDDSTVTHPSGRHFHDPVLAMVTDCGDPNCRLSFELMALIARRDIAAGEVISNDFSRRQNSSWQRPIWETARRD